MGYQRFGDHFPLAVEGHKPKADPANVGGGPVYHRSIGVDDGVCIDKPVLRLYFPIEMAVHVWFVVNVGVR